jgi:DNA-binding HxlR family transcriptional regulator
MGPRHSSQICDKFQTAMDLLGKRWTGLIIQSIHSRPLRFSRLKEVLEVVGDKMLTERLKELEEAGIVERRVLDRPVLRVEYGLTEKGRALTRVLAAAERWADKWIDLPAQKTARGR